MKEKKKLKGGKRVGAGRKPGRQKEAVTVYTDVSKFGGRVGARIAIYKFLDGVISKAGDAKFLPLDLPDLDKKFPPSDLEIKQKAPKEEKRPIVTDLTKSTSVLRPQEQPKTSFTTNTKPRTLDELKALCPAEITDKFDRANWVSTERQKYGI